MYYHYRLNLRLNDNQKFAPLYKKCFSHFFVCILYQVIKSSPTYLMGLLQRNWGKISPCFQSLSAQCMWPYPSEQTYVICTLWILRKLFESLVNALLLFWHQFPFDVLTSYSSTWWKPLEIWVKVQFFRTHQNPAEVDSIFQSFFMKALRIFSGSKWEKKTSLFFWLIPSFILRWFSKRLRYIIF